ncbi:MAG TPA: VWA domain-containing protein [Vicinamibacterales bacterium]|nr:VWA domain-containing protein [Vicinamibacterales bacterium]
MPTHLDHIEFAENPDPRCPCVLLLDVSASMHGDPIQALNEGLRTFQREVSGDTIAARRVEIAIVTFSSTARIVQDFVTVDQFLPPELAAGGQTHLGAGIEAALNALEQRKAAYRSSGVAYYRPWVFLITDGAPVGEAEPVVEAARERLLAEQHAGKLVFFAVGTESADFQRLGTFTLPNRPPLQLRGVQFVELFEWLSKSQQAVAQSRPGEQVPLPPAGWAAV